MTSTQAVLFLSFLQLVFSVENYRYLIPPVTNDIAIILNGGDSQATVKVEFFFDLACSESKRNYIQLQDALVGFRPDQVRVDLYPIILPWHRSAFVESKGLYFVQSVMSGKTLDYIHKVFAKISDFSTKATQNKNEYEVVRALSKIASEATGISEDDLYNNITSNHFHNKVRLSNKLAFQRRTKGTPWVFVNGAETILGTLDDFYITSSEWVDMFNQVLKDSKPPQSGSLVCDTVSGSKKPTPAHVALLLVILMLYGIGLN